jgi:4-alpha-glucanotransferase
MSKLSILSLAIQRMPPQPEKEFWQPKEMPYLSVCSTSSHDMSTLRAWWKENPEASQRFFTIILGNEGEAPQQCEPWICKQIISQHLFSPSMWAIFPIQDLLALDAELQKENIESERINNPSNPNEQWKYRFHINLEDLLKEENFNSKLEYLISESDRKER